jgi:hypothetical protein
MLRYAIVVCVSTLVCGLPAAAVAQTAPPTYEGDPSVYKIIFEDQNFRVIAATWQAGQSDKPHSHSIGSLGYALTDCALKLTSADGKVTNINPKAGHVNTVAMTPSHTAMNVGPSECRVLLIERK